MNNRQKRKILYVLCTAMIFLSPKAVSALDFVTYINKFTKIIYPEINREDQRMSFENISIPYAYNGYVPYVVVKIGMGKTDLSDPRHEKYLGIVDPEFQGRFYFIEDGTLETMLGEGSMFGQMESVLKEIRASDRQWTYQELVDCLKVKGAKYGPQDKDALLKTIPVNQLQELMGKIRILQTVFDVRRDTTEGEPPSLEWRVLMKIKTGRGWMKYVFSFEPFEGKLCSVNCVEFPDKKYKLKAPKK